MPTRWLVLSVVLALCGCSSSQQVWVAQPHHSHVAWDGLGRDPNLPVIKRTRAKPGQPKSQIEDREAELAKVRQFSREWVALRQVIDAEEDARIAKILVICRGCGTTSSETDQASASPLLGPNPRTTEATK